MIRHGFIMHPTLFSKKGIELDREDMITWAGFNSSKVHDDTVKPRAIAGVLPMFPDQAASVSMIKHTM